LRALGGGVFYRGVGSWVLAKRHLPLGGSGRAGYRILEDGGTVLMA
jgi:hypothetical protein